MNQDFWIIAVKIGLAALLAGAVGAEREWTGKWAGLRTHVLIAVGSALLTHVSIYIGQRFAQDSNAWDPGRIAAQIVSGIGFLGAGTIIQSRGTVHGLTTAAGLWVASAIGIAVGAEFYVEASVAAVALLLTLIALKPVERYLLRGDRQTVVLELKHGQSMAAVMDVLERSRVEVEQVSRSGDTISVRFRGSAEASRRLVDLAREEKLLSPESAGPLQSDREGRSE